MEQVSCAVIIVAGGSGRRMGSAIAKQFMFLDSQPILAHTINQFNRALPEAKIIVALPGADIPYWQNLSARFYVAPHKVVKGGKERYDSVRSALEALLEDGEGIEIVAVHDGVRPLVSQELILRTVEAASIYGSAIPVVEATDSFRTILKNGGSQIVDRRPLRHVQTPQVFDHRLLRRAYQGEIPQSTTDDASLVERTGHSLHLVEGEWSNIKITRAEDLIIAQALIEHLNSES